MNYRKTVRRLVFLSLFAMGGITIQAQSVTKEFKETSLSNVLKEVEKQTGFSIMYNNEDLSGSSTVTRTFKKASIEEVLKVVLPQNLDFNLQDKMIVIYKKDGQQTQQKQVKQVTGRVVDDLGEPIIGVSVLEKGTSNGVITDMDGNYNISVSQDATIVFSYIGYITQEKKALSRELNVKLKENTEMLEEVVVVGYGVQKKSSVTGAISQVKSDDMVNRTITSPMQAMQGKTAGVTTFLTSGAPGESPAIRVRGVSSNLGSNPLYVVDGICMDGVSGIDPNDIESMEVLKDAATAAIYGAEAGNGVILITTKKGKAGQGSITYDVQLTAQSLSHKPRLLNANEYMTYMKEGGILGDDILSQWDGSDTDWLNESFETSYMQKHNLAFRGGNDNGNYYLSLSYLDNDGIVKGNADSYQRLTSVINAEYKIKPWMKVGTTNQIEKYNVQIVSTQNEYGSLFSCLLKMVPLTAWSYSPENLPSHMQILLDQGKHLLTDENGNYYGISPFYNCENYHPMIMRDNVVSRSSGFNVNGSIYTNFNPVKEFIFTSRFNYRLLGTRSDTQNLPYYGNAVQSRDYVSLSSSSSTTCYYQWENFANYTKTFNNAHTINAMLGMSFQEQSYQFVTGILDANGEDAVQYNNPLFYYLNYGAASAIKDAKGEKIRNARNSCGQQGP